MPKMRAICPFPLGDHQSITEDALARMVGQTIEGHNATHTVLRAWVDDNGQPLLEIETEYPADAFVFDAIPRTLGSVGFVEDD
jgi:hypothetical protein